MGEAVMAKVRRLSKMTIAKRKAGLSTNNLKHMTSQIDWAGIPRLNARPFQRRRKFTIIVGIPRNRKFNGLKHIAKRTSLKSAQIRTYNKYQTLHAMRGNVVGSWNVKINYIP
jgi:hypothetical protein